MPDGNLKVLLLENSAADAELIQRELDRMNVPVSMERVDNHDAFAQALRDFEPNVIISELPLAQSNRGAAVRVAQELRPTAPFIVATGTLDAHAVVLTLRAGADTVVLKSDLSRLRDAIEAGVAAREQLKKLSPRQLQVLRLVAKGLTTPAIAEELHLSGKTVETHRGEVMKRLGIHDLARLVRYAVRVGLVPQDG